MVEKLAPTIAGRMASAIATLSKKKSISVEKAFDKYLNMCSSKMKAHNPKQHKALLIKKAKIKLGLVEPLEKDETGKTEKVKIENIGGENTLELVEVPKSKNKNSPKKKFATPLALKVDGEVKLIDEGEGVLVKRTDKASKASILCPSGTKGVKIGKDKGGCQFI